MKFGGNLYSNFNSAVKSDCRVYQKRLLIDEIARLIDTSPELVIAALNDAGIKTSESAKPKEIIEKTSQGLYRNSKFKKNLAVLMAETNPIPSKKGKYLNTEGGDSSGGGGGADVGGMIAGIGGTLSGLFTIIGNAQQKKLAEQQVQRELEAKLNQRRSSAAPYIILGVLAVGTLATVIILKAKAKAA